MTTGARLTADTATSTAPPVLLFDGICNLCNGAVRFILRHERDRTVHFAALQSAAGAALLRQCGLLPDYTASLVLIAGTHAYRDSEAVVRVARHLRAPWSLARFARLVPRPLRDGIYRLVAARRYRWFGKRAEACLAPAPGHDLRFLS
ncbi:MAG: DUF393 domain-containing protein [SAR202 cluster bacterium]|nr:DUF393 domain-containing protein [SAR202 cluster bacterium]